MNLYMKTLLPPPSQIYLFTFTYAYFPQSDTQYHKAFQVLPCFNQQEYNLSHQYFYPLSRRGQHRPTQYSPNDHLLTPSFSYLNQLPIYDRTTHLLHHRSLWCGSLSTNLSVRSTFGPTLHQPALFVCPTTPLQNSTSHALHDLPLQRCMLTLPSLHVTRYLLIILFLIREFMLFNHINFNHNQQQKSQFV